MALRLMKLTHRLPARSLRIGLPVQARWGLAARSFATAVDDKQFCMQLADSIKSNDGQSGLQLIHSRLDNLNNIMDKFFNSTDRHPVDGLDSRLDSVNSHLVSVNSHVDNMNNNVDKYLNSIDSHLDNMDNIIGSIDTTPGFSAFEKAVDDVKTKILTKDQLNNLQLHSVLREYNMSISNGDEELQRFPSLDTGEEVENFPRSVNHFYTYDTKAVDKLCQDLGLTLLRGKGRERMMGEFLFHIGVCSPLNKFWPPPYTNGEEDGGR